MHQVIRTIREITAAELPRVRDLATGAERPATDAELLQMGIARVRDDYFSCVELLTGPDSASLAPERALPGRALAAGERRWQRLPAAVRNRVLRARVFRGQPGTSARQAVRAAVDARKPRHAGERRTFEVEEARKLAADPAVPVDALEVFVDEVLPDDDVVEQLDVPPHSWAGEG